MRRAKRKAQSEDLLVLCFHNPKRKVFARIITWLKKHGFIIVSAGDVIEFYKQEKPLPRGAVWLTFDDGWRENLQNVLPVLEEQKVHAEIFISTGAVESGVFWWTYAENFRHLLPEKFKNNVNLLWKASEEERKKTISELHEKIKDKIKREALTIDEVKQISKSQYVTIGSHTVNHAITPNCTDVELTSELALSKQQLENWTGKKINTFAYPNADHTEREEAFLKAAGYEIAVIVSNRFANKKDNPYRIPRMVMGEAYFPEELCHIFGIWQRIIKRKKRK